MRFCCCAAGGDELPDDAAAEQRRHVCALQPPILHPLHRWPTMTMKTTAVRKGRVSGCMHIAHVVMQDLYAVAVRVERMCVATIAATVELVQLGVCMGESGDKKLAWTSLATPRGVRS
jgi:hypothetical protein